jgi:membrane dipeptidase
MKSNSVSRRSLLLGAGALAATARTTMPAWAQQAKQPAGVPPLFMDGHVHITNRVYWEKADFWQPQPGNWDYGRARAGGINCIVDNLGTYGAWNYNYTPKMFLRLIETALRYADQHKDKMAIVTTTAQARQVIGSGRMAVFIGSESGWDHEGDIDVLDAFYRLGLRSIQFATQTGFNAFADSEVAPQQGGQNPDHFHGINDKGRALIAEMNRLGILVDITHGTEQAQVQMIQASKVPVVCSHITMKAVSGVGMSDETLKLLASKGGVVGIHGGSSVVSKRFRQWMADHPDEVKKANDALPPMLGYEPSQPRKPGDHGEYIEMFDKEFGDAWRSRGGWKEIPALEPLIPTAAEWAEHIDHAIKLVGADHVGIGLDMAGGRSGAPRDASGYGEILVALKKVIAKPADLTKVCGENWFRCFDSAKKA